MPKLPPPNAVQRLAEVAERYRQAFAEVQRVLEHTDLGRVPAWVFAIDRLPLDDLRQLSPALGEAEERRRAWRTALHALAEHVALDELVDGPSDAAQLRKLDRFISVVNFAKAGGCIYVDGTFQPVAREAGPAEDPVDPGLAALPEGAHIELADASPAGLPSRNRTLD